jgi:hypothetical protein
VALLAACGGDDRDRLVVGAVEDRIKHDERALEQLQAAGFRAARLTVIWAPGQTAPAPEELEALRRVSEAGVRVYLAVYHAGSATTPLTPEARAQFAEFTAAAVRGVDAVNDVIVGNEPNLNRFWLPQFGPDGEDAAAPAYFALLAAVYDAVKAADAGVTVYGGALAPRGIDRPNTGRDTHSPVTFIEDMGEAFRASGRAAPPLDVFSLHPYPASSALPVDRPHPRTNELGLADHPRLRRLLREAFGRDVPVLYGELGVETVVPPERAAAYSGTEPARTQPVGPATQARAYRRAIELAACQEGVVGLLLFHSHDEPALEGWQSGVYYADATPKPSLDAVRAAVEDARCPG